MCAAGLNGHAFAERAPYDLVVANILAGPLAALAPAIRRHVAPGGAVILSGLLPEQRTRIVATYRATGLVLVRSMIVDGWLTLVMRRPETRARRDPKRKAGQARLRNQARPAGYLFELKMSR
jgi:ribosomal protein L11 methyltransferase